MSDNIGTWPDQGLTVDYFLDLVTAEHNQRPRYMQTVALSVDPYVDGQNIALRYPTLYDLDTAIGEQLDYVGQWVGITRYIVTPIDIYFSFDMEDIGFDEGRWQAPYEDSSITLVRLDDEHYRILLRARIVANYWDGTIEGAYKAWDTLFAGTGYTVLIQNGLAKNEAFFTLDDKDQGLQGFDMVGWYEQRLHYPYLNGNMSIIEALLSEKPVDAVIRALFQGGYMGLDSAGVGTSHVTQNKADVNKPLFALDCGPETPWVTYDTRGLGHDQAFIYADYGINLPPGLDVNTYPPTVLAGFDLGAWARILDLEKL
jgi:hypothetical protein